MLRTLCQRSSATSLNCQKHQHHGLIVVSQRSFAKRGIPRRPRRRRRSSASVYPLPREEGTPPPDLSGSRTLSPTFWGPPRYPIPRVEETSVEFHQNLNSLCRIVKSKLGCLNITVSHYTHSSKAAMERLEAYGTQIESEVPYLHMYQIVIVRDILGYSRDMGSRNTLWIPDDFTVQELLAYLKEECVSDPKLLPTRRVDAFLNPFQPINWKQVNKLEQLDGSWLARSKQHSLKMSTDREVGKNLVEKSDHLQRRNIEPLELVKLREKARNTVLPKEDYLDTSNFFSYWHEPKPRGKQKKSNQAKKGKKSRQDGADAMDAQDVEETNTRVIYRSQPQGRDIHVHEYNVPAESTHVEGMASYAEQAQEKERIYQEYMIEKQEQILSKLSPNDRKALTQEMDNDPTAKFASIEYEYERSKRRNSARVELEEQQHLWNYLDAERNDPNLKGNNIANDDRALESGIEQEHEDESGDEEGRYDEDDEEYEDVDSVSDSPRQVR